MTIFHVSVISFTPLFSMINLIHSHGILQFLQSHFICSLIWHDGYRVKEFTRSETRTKSVVTLARSAVKHWKNSSKLCSPLATIKDNFQARRVQLKEFKGCQPKHTSKPATEQRENTEYTRNLRKRSDYVMLAFKVCSFWWTILNIWTLLHANATLSRG